MSQDDQFAKDVAARSQHGLRGEYQNLGADFVIQQDYSRYTEAHQDVWRRLYSRQLELLAGRACEAFNQALAALDFADGIPKLDAVNAKLFAATQWRLVPVPGLLPDAVFFGHLAQRQFPVTVWIREPHEFDYIVEPDMFHDFFGHVPMLFSPQMADYLQAYGQGGMKAHRLSGLKYLARLYWYTVEFGLIRERGELRAYGAGILSSPGEIRYALDDPSPQRRPFDLIEVMQTRYLIDDFQQRYFVIDSFEQLFEQTAPDFSLLYRALERLPELDPAQN